ncbi:MAG: glycosyltransferase [Ekhidna sp.]
MSSPLVTVICLCHNQAPFVAEAIQSVWDQNYTNVELIVVDDGSTDGSKESIKEILKGSSTVFIDLDKSVGNCTAFNQGLKKAKGEFIIDLAADDILYPKRVSEGIKSFEIKTGINFCDVMMLNEEGDHIKSHYKRDENGVLLETVPVGNIYKELISSYFVSPPSMMIRKIVLQELGGYDEDLSYEDFDFWIRSSRGWKYSFTNEILVGKRTVKNSLSDKQFQFRSRHQKSTLKVCKKIKHLNKSREEESALRKRCLYEIKLCLRYGNLELIPQFLKLI